MDEMEEDAFGQQEVVIKRSKKQVANPSTDKSESVGDGGVGAGNT
jgi:hypothetical protein